MHISEFSSMPSWYRESYTVATTEGDITILRATYGSPVCGEKDVTQKLKEYIKSRGVHPRYRNILFEQLNSIFGDNCVGHHKALNFWYRKKNSGDVLLLSIKNKEDFEDAAESLNVEEEDEEYY
jgi:hypothetical protein